MTSPASVAENGATLITIPNLATFSRAFLTRFSDAMPFSFTPRQSIIRPCDSSLARRSGYFAVCRNIAANGPRIRRLLCSSPLSFSFPVFRSRELYYVSICTFFKIAHHFECVALSIYTPGSRNTPPKIGNRPLVTICFVVQIAKIGESIRNSLRCEQASIPFPISYLARSHQNLTIAFRLAEQDGMRRTPCVVPPGLPAIDSHAESLVLARPCGGHPAAGSETAVSQGPI